MSITRTTLARLYKLNNIRWLRPSFKFCLGRRTLEEQAIIQSKFLKDLLSDMRDEKMIIYIDETSTHLWEKVHKLWMPADDRLSVRFKSVRGKSITIIGAISAEWNDLVYKIEPKTNTQSVKRFFLKMFKQIDHPLRTVVVLDNHTAHTSKYIKKMASNKGIKLLYTPPTDSELNPIERMWALFKLQWRKKLLNPDIHINVRNVEEHIIQTLEMVKHHGKALSKGPI